VESRKQIVISGYYGSGNLGDEAILEALILSLRKKFDRDRVEIIVLSSNPSETEETHGVEAVNRWHPLKVFRQLRSADVLISGGGGLLQDTTSSVSLWYYLGVIWLAKLAGTPVYIVGQGLGPLNRRLNRLLVKFTVKQVEGLLVRDEFSSDLLRDMNVSDEKVVKGTDLAFLLPERKRDLDRFFSEPEPRIVAAALRNDIDGKMDVVRAVSSGLDLLNRKYDINVVLFSTNSYADRQINQDLCEATDASCNIIEVPHLSPPELVEMMEDIDLVIGGRLHAIVFSLLSQTPVQGISYDPKMDHLVDSINDITGGKTVPLWHPEELINARDYLDDLQSVFEHRDEQRKDLGRAKEKLETEARDKLGVALGWIGREIGYV